MGIWRCRRQALGCCSSAQDGQSKNLFTKKRYFFRHTSLQSDLEIRNFQIALPYLPSIAGCWKWSSGSQKLPSF